MSYSIAVKHIFLSFVQALFSENRFITWSLDPRLTKIFIGDEYFISNPVIEKYPSIILKRSGFRWGMHSIDQRMEIDLATNNKKFSDVFYGNITYNVLTKSQQSSERLADYLFANVTAHRDQFRPKGIMKITGINVGEAVTIKGPTDVELVNVPISIGYAFNKELGNVTDLHDIRISASGTGYTGAEDSGDFQSGYYVYNYDFTVSGREVTFTKAPSGVELLIEYVGNITLTEYEEELNCLTGCSEIYTLQEIPRWNFEMLDTIKVYSGIETSSGVEQYPSNSEGKPWIQI